MVEVFANKYQLRLKRHEDGELIVPGKRGHLYEHDDSLLGLLFMPGMPRLWANARRRLEAAGCIIWQDGDEEGVALFDPHNAAQARIALKVVGARPKRTLSSAQLEALEKAREARRIGQKHCAEALVAS